MHRVFVVLALTAGTAAHGQDGGDLMKTPECMSARLQLEGVLAAGGPRDRLAAVRRQAALICLGVSISEEVAGQPRLKTEPATASAPPRQRLLPPPIAVEPIRLRPAPALSLPGVAAAVAAPPAPLLNSQPPVVTSCDAAGCWDSTGARYNQQGPLLIGPRGACSLQAGVLNCP